MLINGALASCTPIPARVVFSAVINRKRPCGSFLAGSFRKLNVQQIELQRLHAQISNTSASDDEEIDELTEEEDWVVPGGYNDSLSSNTPLGQAVREACDELQMLASLERDSLSEAQQLLEKLGYKGNVLHTAGQSLGSAPARIIDVLEPTKREQK